MQDVKPDHDNPFSRGSIYSREHPVKHRLGDLEVGRNLATSGYGHLYRSARFGVVRQNDNGSNSILYFYFHVNRVTYEFDKFGHWSFSFSLHLGRFSLGFHPEWSIGNR